MSIAAKILAIREQLQREVGEAASARDVEVLKVKYLGKKGLVADLMTLLREASPEERPVLGATINDLKAESIALLERRERELLQDELAARLELEKMDISLPGRRHFAGRKHVVLAMMDEALAIFRDMGFSVQLGPDIDTDYYNFEALNFAPDHPARDMQDTFYITENVLLRTHTSNAQIRIMENNAPPIRVVVPGTCFRNEDVSARSHVVFHQIEGFYIDTHVTFADLFLTLEDFFQRFFGRTLSFRYRPSYFPFVEPGLEVDVHCLSCNGTGCSLCKHTGWLEVAGAGMIHPEVLRSGGIDPEIYSGYAWGMGIGRLALMRYNISDIRLYFENNLNFLKQF